MKRILSILGLAIALISAAIDIDALPTMDDTGSPNQVWERYTIAKKRFQFDVFEHLSQKWWDLESTLRWQRDQQLAHIELQNMRFRYLLERHPDRIVMGKGLKAFSDFAWSEEDSRALRAVNPDYTKLEAFLEKVDERLDADPRLTEAQKRMFELSADVEYLQLTTRFGRFTDQLEAELTKK